MESFFGRDPRLFPFSFLFSETILLCNLFLGFSILSTSETSSRDMSKLPLCLGSILLRSSPKLASIRKESVGKICLWASEFGVSSPPFYLAYSSIASMMVGAFLRVRQVEEVVFMVGF